MIEYAGTSDVAGWCGVDQSTVSHWVERFPDYVPEPDAVSALPDENGRRRGNYLWKKERAEAWVLFAAGLRRGQVATEANLRRLKARNSEGVEALKARHAADLIAEYGEMELG
jgi:hypothetical protein